MLGLTTTRRLHREIAELKARLERLRAERDTAREERDAFKAAATTAARQVADVARPRAAAGRRPAVSLAKDERLIEGGTARPLTPSQELQRARAHARELEARLAQLQAVNERCTCGGGSGGDAA